jgi:hypothetical protein
MARDQAQYLGVYVRNQNPRLRTLPLAHDLRLDLRGGDCEAPRNHQLTKLMKDARAMSGPIHTYYFTLTVTGGAVDRVQEFLSPVLDAPGVGARSRDGGVGGSRVAGPLALGHSRRPAGVKHGRCPRRPESWPRGVL